MFFEKGPNHLFYEKHWKDNRNSSIWFVIQFSSDVVPHPEFTTGLKEKIAV